jgi:ankyrin repeat protein
VASYKGSEVILRQIIKLLEADGTTTDEPGPDGTTAFHIAVGKKFTNIVDIFLEANIGESRFLNTAAEKERKRSSNKEDIFVEKW